MEYPYNFARFYDVIYHRQRDGVDNDFFQEMIRNSKGKVLEIGVGTGRLFIEALENGADVYGIDISPSMLKVLKKKLPRKHHNRVSRQNITDFSFDFKFDLIIAPFHMFSHLIDKDEQLKGINNVFRNLKKDGVFIFDIFVPDLKQLVNRIENYTDFKEEYEPGKFVKRVITTKPDLITQVINIKFKMEWDENGGAKSEEWKFPFRFFFRYELEHLVERSKFRKYEILGDYDGGMLKKDSKEFIMICRKG